MSSPRGRPAIERARDYLLGLLGERRPDHTQRLPGIRELAAAAGVSHVTMWKAVQTLKQEGVVQTAPERMIFAGPAEPPPPRPPQPAASAPPARPRWQELREAIAADLLALRLPAGAPLPSTKELCARYATGRVSVGRALRALLAEGRLARDGRRLRTRMAVSRVRQATVVFVAEQQGGDVLGDLAPRSLELWRDLEQACRRRNLRLVARSALECMARVRRGGPEPGVMGYVVRNLEGEVVARVLAALAPTGLPVGLVDEVGLSRSLTWPQRSSRFRSFAIAHSDRPGREVADHLLALGHRRVAGFSAYGGADWSDTRLQGIVEAFRSAGLRSATETFVGPCFPNDLVQRLAITSTAGYELVLREAEGLLDALDPGRGQDLYAPHPDPFLPLLIPTQIAGCMRPHFEQALRDRSFTTWVGANDFVALAALRFLTQAGRRVPQDVSVVGFDNNLGALRSDLASYDFNIPALANALVEHVTSWRTRSGRDHGPVLEIPGTLVERGSLGPPAGRR
jgi:DNA-binding transcriptional regulator YhcF (GntR family)